LLRLPPQTPQDGAQRAPSFKPLARLLLPSGKLFFVRIFAFLGAVGDALRGVPIDAK
jgi:hypothetical protein